jgi:hypothetical protein
VSSSADYRVLVRFLSTGEVSATLIRTVGGVQTSLVGGKIAGLTHAPGEVLNVRLQVTGTSPTALGVKVWKQGTAEPAAWQYQRSDSTAGLQVAGGVGLIHYLSGSSTNAPNTVTVDNLEVGQSLQ